MSEKPKKRGVRRVVVGALAFFVLNALSRGPTRSLAITCGRATYDYDGSGNVGVCFDFDYAPWWQTTYAPLQWAAEQSWGDPIMWYWNLFPDDPRRT